MSSFGGADLFGSGRHRVVAEGLFIRHSLQATPGGRGVELKSHGLSGRKIEQEGVLIADDSSELELLASAVEARLDGVARELSDDLGRVWGNTVMIRFERERVRRAGVRWVMGYRVEYLQVAAGV